MRIGTSHFSSFEEAVKYYRPYFGEPFIKGRRRITPTKDATTRQAVRQKIEAGEIHIGQPPHKADEQVILNHEEGRYFLKV